MKAILSKDYRILKFYDQAIASGIESIIEILRVNEDKDPIALGLKYEGTKADKTVLQMIKILDASSHKTIILYLDTSHKLYKDIVKNQPALTIKKFGFFDKFKSIYVMKSNYVTAYLKAKYNGKNEFYNDNVLDDIWDAYYEPHEEDEDEV